MKTTVALAGALALLAAAGCGSSSSRTCADMANHVNGCIVQAGGAADATIQAQCDGAVCTPASAKQPLIDCIMGLSCAQLDVTSATVPPAVVACLSANSCTF